MNLKKTICLAALATLIGGLVGCAAPGSGLKRPENLTLVNPATTPKEQWSDALVMMTEQMGIPGMMDAAPGSAMGSGGELVNQVNERSHENVGLEIAALSGSIGAGMAFGILQSPRGNRMIVLPQIAYWVPADLVSSPEEAAAWVLNDWGRVRLNAVRGTKREAKIGKTGEDKTTGLPRNHPSQFPSLNDARKRNYRPFQAEAREQVVGQIRGTFYGPIFVAPGGAGIELILDKQGLDLPTEGEMMDLYGRYLPDTAMIYYQGVPHPKGYEPGFVLHQGQRHYFIAKGGN